MTIHLFHGIDAFDENCVKCGFLCPIEVSVRIGRLYFCCECAEKLRKRGV